MTHRRQSTKRTLLALVMTKYQCRLQIVANVLLVQTSDSGGGHAL